MEKKSFANVSIGNFYNKNCIHKWLILNVNWLTVQANSYFLMVNTLPSQENQSSKHTKFSHDIFQNWA